MSGSAWAGSWGRVRGSRRARVPRPTEARRTRGLVTSGWSPLRVVRLPGELTGSGTTCPTPAPRPAARLRLRLASRGIHPRRVGSPAPAPHEVGAGLSAAPARTWWTHLHEHLSSHRSRSSATAPSKLSVPIRGAVVSHTSHQPHEVVSSRRLDLRPARPAGRAAAAAPARCRPGRRARGARRRRGQLPARAADRAARSPRSRGTRAPAPRRCRSRFVSSCPEG